jgi:hypothetical protein
MKSRWSADSSTNETTADRPAVAARELRQARVVEAHRDLAGEVLEEVAGEAELREDDELRAPARASRRRLVMPREVLVQVSEARGDLGEGDAERGAPWDAVLGSGAHGQPALRPSGVRVRTDREEESRTCPGLDRAGGLPWPVR